MRFVVHYSVPQSLAAYVIYRCIERFTHIRHSSVTIKKPVELGETANLLSAYSVCPDDLITSLF